MLKALKRSIKRPEKISGLEKPKVHDSILMNQNRQKILQFLFKYPCTHLHGIARNFELSINATRWHLQKLISRGYLEDHELGNKKVYYPNHSLQEIDIRILGLLNDTKLEPYVQEILCEPGITQKELYQRLNKKQSTSADNLTMLEKNELITSRKDGLYVRYYPTKIIQTRERHNRKALKEYRRYLLHILERDGMEPLILRTTDKKVHIRINSGKGKSDLIFHFNPYERFIR